MSEQTYSLPVFDTIKSAWKLVSGSKATLWAVAATICGILFIIGFVMGIFSPLNGALEKFINIAAEVIQLIGTAALLYLGIQRALDKPIKYTMASYIFNFWLILKLIGLYILTILIMLPPLFLMIASVGFGKAAYDNLKDIPTLVSIIIFASCFVLIVFLAIRMYVANAIVLHQQVGPWAAIKASFQATKSNVWRLIGLVLLNIILCFVAIMPLFVLVWVWPTLVGYGFNRFTFVIAMLLCSMGIIWFMPYFIINYGMVYRKLVLERQA